MLKLQHARKLLRPGAAAASPPPSRVQRLTNIDAAALARALPISAVMLLALVLNLPTLDDYFHGDDFVAFTELSTKEPLRFLYDSFFFQDVNFYWRPLGQASYLALYHVFGLKPAAFHGLSIAMFLATVWLLYRFCLNAGLTRTAGAGAAALFAVLPNHVVSVAWVTNSPRVMAVMFFMISLVLLQRALAKRSLPVEAAAWLVFLLCPLADETSLALAPVPVLYAAVYTGRLRFGWPLLVRSVAYLGAAAALAPLQFMFTLDDEPRLAEYGAGDHILAQTWALTSQLVLPLAEGSPLALSFEAVPPEQWAAGAIAIALGVLLFLAGSWKMRLLVAWTVMALAPFTLWDIEWMSPRYVYMAAVPYSIIVAWLITAAVEALAASRRLQLAAAGALTATALFAGILSAQATMERNDQWAESTEPFRVLATGMPQAVPDPPPGGRVVIYFGIWHEFPLWPRVVLRTVYGDDALEVVNVSRGQVDANAVRREAQDIVVFYNDGRFIASAPRVSGAQ